MRFLSLALRLRNPNPSLRSLLPGSRSLASIRSPGDRPQIRRERSFTSVPAVSLRSPSSGTLLAASDLASPPKGRTMAAVAAALEEGSPAKRFWMESKKETVFASYTPFVVCLAAGRLELETFRNYIAQDVHFLRAFAKAYEMAEECTDDDDAKATIVELRNALLEELKMHNSVIQEWGIDPTKDIVLNSATTKYTDFLIATASGKVDVLKGPGKIATPFEKTKIAAYTVGAMTPCMRLYAHLGKELKGYLNQDESDHPYKKWIEKYSSKSFEESTAQIEELLDKLSVSLTGEELEVIGKLYQQAMKLEVEFFSAQTITGLAIVPLTRYMDPRNKFVVFSDFDLTCTEVDSSAILAEIAILTAQKADQSGIDKLTNRKSSSDLRNAWNILSRQYTEEYEHCIESLLPQEEGKSFDYDHLYKNLQLLSDFEKRVNSRVINSGVLKGVYLDDIKKAGEHLILQDGCRSFFQSLVKTKEKANLDIHILSYCWCADLIRSAFLSVGCLNELSIHSNELSFEGSISTGEFDRKMESPVDKVENFKAIVSSLGHDQEHLSVYIGDSVGDLLCLLQADVGIVVGSSLSLRRVGKQFGVSFVPLFPGLINKQKQLSGQESFTWNGLSGVLYTVSSWSEIYAFILGA